MPDMTPLPAHGPLTGSSHARVDELVAHHDSRRDPGNHPAPAGSWPVRHSKPGQPSRTCGELARPPLDRFRAGVRDQSLRDLDVFNSVLATLETFAHLELLAGQDRIGRSDAAGTVTFAALPWGS